MGEQGHKDNTTLAIEHQLFTLSKSAVGLLTSEVCHDVVAICSEAVTRVAVAYNVTVNSCIATPSAKDKYSLTASYTLTKFCAIAEHIRSYYTAADAKYKSSHSEREREIVRAESRSNRLGADCSEKERMCVHINCLIYMLSSLSQ